MLTPIPTLKLHEQINIADKKKNRGKTSLPTAKISDIFEDIITTAIRGSREKSINTYFYNEISTLSFLLIFPLDTELLS